MAQNKSTHVQHKHASAVIPEGVTQMYRGTRIEWADGLWTVYLHERFAFSGRDLMGVKAWVDVFIPW